MTKRREIFIFGSRAIDELPDGIEKVIDTLMMLKTNIIVGDCTGIDFAVQQYLYENNYKKVKVFTSNEVPRNVMGDGYLYTPANKVPKNLSMSTLMTAMHISNITESNIIKDNPTIKNNAIDASEHNKYVEITDSTGTHGIYQHLYKNDLGWRIISLYSKELKEMYGEESKEFHRIKDIHMLNICDGGIAIWNGSSRATNNNINELIKRHKKCTVFLREYFR